MTTPVTFDLPTLGRSVLLGQVYNAHASRFLDFQLYDAEKLKEAKFTNESNINYTHLSLTKVSSFKDKASVLDINADLAVELLSGLVKVKGSAEYLKDTKSNSTERSWAMSVKMRLKEKKLLFAHDELAHNVLKEAKDRIATYGPTHFVSSIVYGGNVVVDLVANSSKLTEEEKIEGSLQVELQKLKAAVDLNAKADVKVKGQFDDMNDKFNLDIRGDITLGKLPANAEDVLEFFPTASGLITQDGGVAISATLTPISDTLRDATILIHNLDGDLLNEILASFGNLDDIRTRFSVLKKRSHEDIRYVPCLVAAVDAAFVTFRSAHSRLKTRLAEFVPEFHAKGTKTERNAGLQLVLEAETLFGGHVRRVDKYQAPTYPDTLAGLEQAHLDFRGFSAVVQDLGLKLNVLSDVQASAIRDNVVRLFLMSPRTSSAGATNLIHFSSLAQRGQKEYLAAVEPPLPADIHKDRKTNETRLNPPQTLFLYVEEPAALEALFPNNNEFAELRAPSHFIGKVDEGKLSWSRVRFSPDITVYRLFDSKMMVRMYADLRGTCIRQELDISGNMSFTLAATVKTFSGYNSLGPATRIFLTLDGTYTDFNFQVEAGVVDVVLRSKVNRNRVLSMAQGNRQSCSLEGYYGTNFSVAFVQDVTEGKWIFYVDGQKINEHPFHEQLRPSGLAISMGAVSRQQFEQLWHGEVKDVQAYPKALTHAEIQAAQQAVKR